MHARFSLDRPAYLPNSLLKQNIAFKITTEKCKYNFWLDKIFAASFRLSYVYTCELIVSGESNFYFFKNDNI